METIAFLNEYMVPVIIGICLVVGYLVKHSITAIPNKYIPVIVSILGLGISVWIDWGAVTPGTVLSGLFSGLASTGLHQLVKEMLAKNDTAQTETK